VIAIEPFPIAAAPAHPARRSSSCHHRGRHRDRLASVGGSPATLHL